MACGQSLAALRSGRAECTPNFRASYDAAETTPRWSLCPPTTTALPFSDGSDSSSTETKKASISTWKMVRGAGGTFLTIHQNGGQSGQFLLAQGRALRGLRSGHEIRHKLAQAQDLRKNFLDL